MTIADLIKSVEGLTGPERAIDGLAWKLTCEQPGDVWSMEIDGTVWCRQDPEDRIAYDTPPTLTASVDAVIALIGEKLPNTHSWSVTDWAQTDLPRKPSPSARVWSDDDEFTSRAPTPALALLLAFLRAWEARGDG